jgi:hypothetical protein
MSLRKLFPFSWSFCRTITSPLARRIYFSLLIVLLVVTTTARVRSILLVRRISPILSGMAQIRLDQTTKEEFLRAIPSLVRANQDWNGQRVYTAVVSNESDWLMSHLIFGSAPYWLLHTWEWLGYRYIYFEAGAAVLDGKVTSLRYGIATQMGFPRQVSYIVSAKSVHGFWEPHNSGFLVTSLDDESPQYRVRGSEERRDGFRDGFVSAVFTSDAPIELTSHAFRLVLSCFWSLRGCRAPSQVAPLLWRDKGAIEAAAVSRLKSREPCPDRILASRIRYLPDLDVLLFQVTAFRKELINIENQDSQEFITDYKLVDVIRGRSRRSSWEGVRYRRIIPSPTGPLQRIANPMSPVHQVGDQVLMFSNHNFSSCQVVPATPSALSAVRAAIPAPRHPEDVIVSLQ